jgi:hypothetical protein
MNKKSNVQFIIYSYKYKNIDTLNDNKPITYFAFDEHNNQCLLNNIFMNHLSIIRGVCFYDFTSAYYIQMSAVNSKLI